MRELKLVISGLMLAILTSCSSDDEVENKAPGMFTITTEVDEGSNTVVSWTEAVDPDGDAVVYDVYFKGTIQSNDLKTRQTTISSSTVGSGGVVKVVAKDSKGATSSAEKTINYKF